MAKKAKPAETPREGVNTRITRDLREKLDEAAAAAGRSTGSEIERRLEQSFRFRPELLALLEDERTLSALSAVAISWHGLEAITRKSWYEDLPSLLAAQSAAHSVLGYCGSKSGESISGSPDKITPQSIQGLTALGALLADITASRIKNRPFEKNFESAVSLGFTLFGVPGESQVNERGQSTTKKTRNTQTA